MGFYFYSFKRLSRHIRGPQGFKHSVSMETEPISILAPQAQPGAEPRTRGWAGPRGGMF